MKNIIDGSYIGNGVLRTFLSIVLLMSILEFAGAVAAAAKDVSAAPSVKSDAIQSAVDIEVFVRGGCPHCENAKVFLSDLKHQRPELRITMYDVGKDAAALARLQEISKTHGAAGLSVPVFYIHEHLIVGYSDATKTGDRILAELEQRNQKHQGSFEAAESCSVDASLSCDVGDVSKSPEPETFEIEFLGRKLSLSQAGLPLFTLALGLLDGFNPCSMWVLILMISLLAPMQNRWRMLAVAGSFVAVEGIAYFAFMAAWLNLFLIIGLSRPSEIIIAAIALFAGAINVKDFIAYGQGISLSIPQTARPRIYAGIRSILQAENLFGAMVAAVVLAVLVQIVEFLCTTGFPALYTRILTLRHLSGWDYYAYLLLYNAAYMFDDVVVLAIGIITLSQRRLQEHEGRWLKLLSGAVMLGLGFYLLLRP